MTIVSTTFLLIFFICALLFVEVSTQCTICYNNASGFDPTLEYFDTEIGHMTSCSRLKESSFIFGDNLFCSFVQKIAHDSCGCQEAPSAAACPVCFEDGPGFDLTRKYVGEDGEIVKCSDAAAAIALTGDNPNVCALLQLNNYVNCGCSTKPNGASSTITPGSNSLCPVCYKDGPGFDPSIEFVSNDGETSKCSDIAIGIAFIGQDPFVCAALQLNNHLNCGCSTIPQGGNPSCPICYNNGSGFDPKLNFVDNGNIAKCSDIATSMAFIRENPDLCATLQLNNHLNCGCSTKPSVFAPTDEPTFTPTDTPISAAPVVAPTDVPTSATPVVAPTDVPTSTPTDTPISAAPVVAPTDAPTSTPTDTPISAAPVVTQTDAPTSAVPVVAPTDVPTSTPTDTPISAAPVVAPTGAPTSTPTDTFISAAPVVSPTDTPTSAAPVISPTDIPTPVPTDTPISAAPVVAPTDVPTSTPTDIPISTAPVVAPTDAPTSAASVIAPTDAPTSATPVVAPTDAPTSATPVIAPTDAPSSAAPVVAPTDAPTSAATDTPISATPVVAPTDGPTSAATNTPISAAPIVASTNTPTLATPAVIPTDVPISAVALTDPPLIGFPIDNPPAPVLIDISVNDPSFAATSTSAANGNFQTFVQSSIFIVINSFLLKILKLI